MRVMDGIYEWSPNYSLLSKRTLSFLCVAILPHPRSDNYSRHLCKGSRAVVFSFPVTLRMSVPFKLFTL